MNNNEFKSTQVEADGDFEEEPTTSMDSLYLFTKMRKHNLGYESPVACEKRSSLPSRKRFTIKELLAFDTKSRAVSDSTFRLQSLKELSTRSTYSYSELLSTKKKSTTNSSKKSQCTIHSTYQSTTSTYAPIPITEVLLRKLYIGTWDNAKDESLLKSKEITHVLSVIGPKHDVIGIKYKHIPMNDRGRTDLKKVMSECYDFMVDSQGPGKSLFVHCQSGQNRSPTIVIAFLMMHQGLTLYRAHRKVKDLRPIVQVNVNYAKQLLDLERELFKETSLPDSWMELSHLDLTTGDVCYMCERLNSLEHEQFKKSQKVLQSDL